MDYVIGVDIGGTFTDCVALRDGVAVHAKTLSTHATSPSEGVLRGIGLLAEAVGAPLPAFLSATRRVSHGTTIGTNLVVERKGARVALATTVGHRDVLGMMRGSGRTAGLRPERMFDVRMTAKPPPLCARADIVEIHERIDRDGAVVAPLDEARARASLEALLADPGIEALAVMLLWSFRNPAHERRVAAMARSIRPDLFVTLSSEVSPRLGEYERCVATVMNAYVGPASSRYLRATAGRLADAGLAGPFLVMQANGGVVPSAEAERLPLMTLDSGPAGGLAGCARLAAAAGHRNVIATDMGGTSFDVGLIVDGRPVVGEDRVLNQYAYRAPHLDVRSIACGGGSIARFDPATGGLRVGPESAGSNPGPVCYGRGGRLPTVTDADVVVGLVRADGFLDGRMALDADGARAAMAALGATVGLGIEETAAGILAINNHAAADLIRQRTIEQGLDPRDFTLYAFGGAGPVHAFGFAAELGIGEVVIPLGNGASTLSAYGIAASDVVRFFDRECSLPLPLDPDGLAALLEDLNTQAVAALAAQGFARDALRIERFALMRFEGQLMQSLPLPLPDDRPDAGWNAAMDRGFLQDYARLYGPTAAGVLQGVEIFTLRLRVTVPFADVRNEGAGSAASDAPPAMRPVYWPDGTGWADTAVWRGDALPSAPVAGPALVELPHTTVAIGHGQSLRSDRAGHLVLSLATGGGE